MGSNFCHKCHGYTNMYAYPISNVFMFIDLQPTSVPPSHPHCACSIMVPVVVHGFNHFNLHFNDEAPETKVYLSCM